MFSPRLNLVVGRDGILEVEHDDVGAEIRRLLQHPLVASGDGQLTAVKTCGGWGHGGSKAAPAPTANVT